MKMDVKLAPNGGAITLELTFGFACVGSYEATIFDVNNQNGDTFQSGASTDVPPDIITLPNPPATLLNRTLLIDAALVPPAPPDMVSLTAQVLQGGVAIPGASLTSKASVNPGQKATPMLFFRFIP
jgi:hypothetical protein